MALIDSTVCLFCLNPSAARVGLDKKGRPFVHCIGCGARCFLPSFSPCLNGLAVLTPIARAIIDEVAQDRTAWERQHGQIATLLAQLKAAVVPASTATTPTANGAPVVTPIARPA